MFLSLRESTMPGTVWRTYVHVQMSSRMTRSKASKWNSADCIGFLISSCSTRILAIGCGEKGGGEGAYHSMISKSKVSQEILGM